jgi:hypothetical protein
VRGPLANRLVALAVFRCLRVSQSFCRSRSLAKAGCAGHASPEYFVPTCDVPLPACNTFTAWSSSVTVDASIDSICHSSATLHHSLTDAIKSLDSSMAQHSLLTPNRSRRRSWGSHALRSIAPVRGRPGVSTRAAPLAVLRTPPRPFSSRNQPPNHHTHLRRRPITGVRRGSWGEPASSLFLSIV